MPERWPGETAGQPRLSAMGVMASLFEAPGAFTLRLQQRIWTLADRVAAWPEVAQAVPGVTNLLVLWHEPPADLDGVHRALAALWPGCAPRELSGRTLEVPVAYGGPEAIDLAAVCAHTGLAPRELIRRHAAGHYTVCAIGAAPGFGYLHGLDPALACPRKAVPAMRVPAGAVTIGGPQTGVSVVTSPNGWNVIGHTPLALFDLAREPAALLAPGDRVRFVEAGPG